jgi:hypothetical protein
MCMSPIVILPFFIDYLASTKKKHIYIYIYIMYLSLFHILKLKETLGNIILRRIALYMYDHRRFTVLISFFPFFFVFFPLKT